MSDAPAEVRALAQLIANRVRCHAKGDAAEEERHIAEGIMQDRASRPAPSSQAPVAGEVALFRERVESILELSDDEWLSVKEMMPDEVERLRLLVNAAQPLPDEEARMRADEEWVLVPKRATPEMVRAYCDWYWKSDLNWAGAWDAMLSAARAQNGEPSR